MKPTAAEKLFYVCNNIVLALIGLTCLLPLIYLGSVSLSSQEAVLSGRVSLWPVQPNLDNYRLLLDGTSIVRALLNSILLTGVGVVLNMLFTIMAAYPLSRPRFWGRRRLTLLLLFTMLFNAGLIPNYLLINALGLIDTYWALWLPALVSVYNMLVLKTSFEAIPGELEDAARIDGCGEIRLLFSVALPLCVPVLAALVLFYAVDYWNSFYNVLIYINSTDKQNLAVLVQQMVMSSFQRQMEQVQPDAVQSVTPEAIRAASIVIMIVPMLIVYPFVQKYFVKGIMIGSIKG